jgi:hypothetical protein
MITSGMLVVAIGILYTVEALEMSERNCFHRSGLTVRDPRVMHDLAIAKVDSVTQIATSGCDDARIQRLVRIARAREP